MARRILLTSAVALAAALTFAGTAWADIVVSQDAQGRQITFDVRADGVDVEWYAAILRSAAHGDEISTVTIRIVPASDVPRFCGAAAAACYGRGGGGGLMVVPAGRDERVASTFLHEYGHHLDRAWSVNGVREPNGTPAWYAARGIQQLLDAGDVTFDYSLGWSRSVAEIFAEDYAYIHLGGLYSIWWLSPPDESLKAALLAELGGAPATPPAEAPTPPPATPLVIVRSGVLAPRGQRAIPFGLLGPGRRVTFTVTAAAPRRPNRRLRLDVVCNGQLVGRRAVAAAARTATVDLINLGPASCRATLVSTSRSVQRYTLRLRLAVEQLRA